MVDEAKRSGASLDSKTDDYGPPVKEEGRLAVKYRRIKGVIFGESGVTTKFVQGFKMGFIVGGMFGGVTGLGTWFKTGSFLYFPLMAVISGGSFGFFLGVGTVVRTQELNGPLLDKHMVYKDGHWVLEQRPVFE